MPESPLAVIAFLLLAGCGANEAERKPAPSVAEPPQPAGGQATAGGDGSPVILSPLSSAEIEHANLRGELGCGFDTDRRETLLVAMGDVASQEPAFGIVKVGDFIEEVSARGGFDAMVDGATFSGRGKTVVIEVTSPKPVGGGESPPFPARLTYQRADGASRSFVGTWACGP